MGSSRERKNPQYCRSPHLVCYWAQRQLVFENYATGARIGGDALICEILDFFDRWRPAEELSRRFPDYSAGAIREAVAKLTRLTLLQSSAGQLNARERAMETWSDWNPAAGFFHFSTKNVHKFRALEKNARVLMARARKNPPPSPVKKYRGAKKIVLPEPETKGEFPHVLLERRTWRRFATAPVRLAELSTLLGLTSGVRWWVKLPGRLGRVALKTSPSAGARHPIELYVVAVNVEGLARGIYHYAGDKHCLELMRRGATRRQMVDYLAGQWWDGAAGALVLMTAVFARSQWKYEFPRAYRTMLLDAGHVCQTFCLVATWLGLAPFCTAALDDARVEKDLGVDGVTESVLYAAGVGTKPEGVEWGAWPEREIGQREPNLRKGF